jgi:multiple sugar transport system ATP-binding protein
MTVADNIAYGLRIRRMDKAEIDRRVRKVADVLELGNLLDRRPKQLSGGQRQRVAMGLAIVREPKVFLMDEPLSNLDAKLRVQMRSEIAQVQHDLNVTTIYVTHDQTEAMTMGDARLAPRPRVRAGDQVEVVVDTERMHFFDPETGNTIRD